MPKAFTALSIALICFVSASMVSGEVGSYSDRIVIAKKSSHSTDSQAAPSISRQSSDPAKVVTPPKVEKVSNDTVILPQRGEFNLLARDPLDMLKLDNIKPLYTSPALQGEGVWESSGSPRDSRGRPLVYKTFYRPSVDFPNAVVYMMVIDMSMTSIRYYVGSQEPAASKGNSEVEQDIRAKILAVTNAMWMQRHSKGAGAIFRGKVLYPMINGMASLIVYKDGSIDVREWTPDIPTELVQDARQLRHLIVKDGMVVQAVLRKGRLEDSEIGLGFLLGGGGRDMDGKHAWFVAHRSAFGIRKDGNLVFAIGHHIGSKDVAKALVLAGCERGLHGDANPDNIVANLYIRDIFGNMVRKVKLSPEQANYTLNRYDDSYSKDFFAFFLKEGTPLTTSALTRHSGPTLKSNR
ncbi:MAG: hypothetical protein WCP72_04650 [Desulfomonile sp.]